MPQPTDFFLLQWKAGTTPWTSLIRTAAELCAAGPMPMTLHRLANSLQTSEVYLYARVQERMLCDADVLLPLTVALQRHHPDAEDIRVSRLERVFDIAGSSQTQAPVFHYAVEMDPDAGWMPEISRWYDTEHMPGLAAVPGCIHAMRFLNHDHGPLSLACYDLVTQDTLGSPPWLAVRGTAWSDITRPHFTNTKRTMFEVVA